MCLHHRVSRKMKRKVLIRSIALSILLLYIFLNLVFPSEISPRQSKKMPLNTVDATVANFDQIFEKFRSETPKQQKKLLLFLADKDPSTGLSWCPDCVRAEPVICKKLESSSSDVSLLRAFVGDRPTWRNPSHPWRVDPRFKLKGVPTLVYWDDETVKGRLEDHEAHVEAKIDALIADK